MQTYLILRRSGWSTPRELEVAVGRASRAIQHELAGRVRWIRSYVIHETDGRLGLGCIFQSTDVAAIREHARSSRIPADEILPLGETVVINDDPPALT